MRSLVLPGRLEARPSWERGHAGPPRGQPAWGARSVRTERAARKVFSTTWEERAADAVADEMSALPAITGTLLELSLRW